MDKKLAPYYLTKNVAQRYLPAIGQAVKAHPDAVMFDPKPFSTETFSHNLRAAMNYCIAKDSSFGHFDFLKFMELKREKCLQVRKFGDSVVIGPRHSQIKDFGGVSSSSNDLLKVTDPEDDQLLALIILCHYQTLKEVQILCEHKCPHETKNVLTKNQEKYDIDFTQIDPDTFILL